MTEALWTDERRKAMPADKREPFRDPFVEAPGERFVTFGTRTTGQRITTPVTRRSHLPQHDAEPVTGMCSRSQLAPVPARRENLAPFPGTCFRQTRGDGLDVKRTPQTEPLARHGVAILESGVADVDGSRSGGLGQITRKIGSVETAFLDMHKPVFTRTIGLETEFFLDPEIVNRLSVHGTDDRFTVPPIRRIKAR